MFKDSTALWIRAGGVTEFDTWLYRPATFPELTEREYEQGGWQRITTPVHLARYCSQLLTIRQAISDQENAYWIQAAEVEQSSPVILAFSVARWVTEVSQAETSIQVANMLPGPQLGEVALVPPEDGREGWQVYTLAQLGEAGFHLWRRLGSALKSLSSPAEWWPLTPLLDACLRGEYAQLRAVWREELRQARISDEHLNIRLRLQALERARQQARLLWLARDYALRRPEMWLAQWNHIKQLAQELAMLYWKQHLSSIASSGGSRPDLRLYSDEEDEVALLEELVPSLVESLWIPNFAPDQAIREATLARMDDWEKSSSQWCYRATNDLAIYFLDREHPLGLEDAQAQLLRIQPSTLRTMRVALGLWYLRRDEPRWCRKDRSVGMTYHEILAWCGVRKGIRRAYPGTSSMVQVTDGNTLEELARVKRDFEIASCFWVRGTYMLKRHARAEWVQVDDPYLRVSFVSRPIFGRSEELLGVFVAPGPWMEVYEQAEIKYLAYVSRRVFQLHPHNEPIAFKLALFLVEWWRLHTRKKHVNQTISMADLLRRSMVPVDRKNLTNRFIPRVEEALALLAERGIIGSLQWQSQIDRTRGQWGNAWLGARVRLLPPLETQEIV